MNTNIIEDLTDIRPATRALKQISIARLNGGKGRYEGTHHCALLMLDPDCVEMPSALLRDTVLQPVDKIVLLLIMMITRLSTGDAFLPTQAQLARMANVSSADTIWRALLILRCSRWLTSCQKMWCKGGLLEPSAYVANAKPLPVADTLFLDPEYVPFLKKTVGHTHARVRKIASKFLSQLPEETRNRPVEQRTLSNLKF